MLKRFTTLLILFICSFGANGQTTVEQWDRFELSLRHPATGNPFTSVTLSATFTGPDTSYVVPGFYDGDDQFKIRFMPKQKGTWKYSTNSNVKALHGKKGEFECVGASPGNQGIVEVSNVYHFRYSDGKPYYPFGTTSYAWTHMSEGVQEMTLKTLKNSRFNKIRMGVFPKNYQLVKEEPGLYPFTIKEIKKDASGKETTVWDFDKFNPAFFQHLEKRVDELKELGIEADLILFHPYDKGRWGFDEMPVDVNLRYIRYLTARIASFRNVWWSLANEWDYVKSKTVADWDILTKEVVKNDPYRHLCSIHGATGTYFDYWKPEFTHVSIQDETPVQNSGSAAMLRHIYKKPIVADEVGYEGNLKSRWGRYSPEEMTLLTLNGVMGGIYVTHGESYMFNSTSDTIFWAKGGDFKGTSWKSVGFLRDVVEQSPNPLQLADIGRDNRTATAGENYFFVNLGRELSESWLFNLPAKNADYPKIKPGARFRVDIIDLENQTITPYPTVFEAGPESDYRFFDTRNQKVYLPLKPLILLRIRETK